MMLNRVYNSDITCIRFRNGWVYWHSGRSRFLISWPMFPRLLIHPSVSLTPGTSAHFSWIPWWAHWTCFSGSSPYRWSYSKATSYHSVDSWSSDRACIGNSQGWSVHPWQPYMCPPYCRSPTVVPTTSAASSIYPHRSLGYRAGSNYGSWRAIRIGSKDPHLPSSITRKSWWALHSVPITSCWHSSPWQFGREGPY